LTHLLYEARGGAHRSESANRPNSLIRTINVTARYVLHLVYGAIAERLCSGLQSRVDRFDSGSRLQISPDLVHCVIEKAPDLIFNEKHGKDEPERA
jgi:hypothetical protein